MQFGYKNFIIIWHIILPSVFYTVGWVASRPVKMSFEVLVWLSVWSEVQIVCICSSWCHCIPKPHHFLPHLNPDWFYLSGTSLPRLSWVLESARPPMYLRGLFSKGRDRQEGRRGTGREKGKELGRGRDLPDQCQTTSYTRRWATACEDLLPIRMHTYVLERSYSTRTTMKRTNFPPAFWQTGFKFSKTFYS